MVVVALSFDRTLFGDDCAMIFEFAVSRSQFGKFSFTE
jgi:hypothetical protein